MEALLNDSVRNKAGETVSVSSFSGPGKLVGLYFSAHWCPPCRGFTPVLEKFYNKVKASAKGANFEIIFVSFDRTAQAFKEYYDTMTWLTIDFDDQETRNGLGDKFDVKGIPSFVILNGENGEVKDKNARGRVTADPDGDKFPWDL